MRKIITITFALILGLSFSMPAIAQKQSTKKMDSKALIKDAARQDIANKEMKYYRFGLLPTNQEVIQSFKKKYNISIIDRGCVMNNDDMLYNEYIAGQFYQQFGRKIEKELEVMSAKK